MGGFDLLIETFNFFPPEIAISYEEFHNWPEIGDPIFRIDLNHYVIGIYRNNSDGPSE